VATPDTGDAHLIKAAGLNHITLEMSRKGLNPFRELKTMVAFWRLYRDLSPQIIHHVTVKPIIYGSIMASLLNKSFVVNAISGLGYVFTSLPKNNIVRLITTFLYKLALNTSNSKTIFQNPDDLNLFIQEGMIEESKTRLILGSGVNCSVFSPMPAKVGDVMVMLPARMLFDKGIYEFVNAVTLLKADYPKVKFVLVGRADDGNPAIIPTKQLRAWEMAGLIEWWGYKRNMNEVLNMATMVVLPSYREGLPKVLLEAAACSKPIISTNVPGCKEIVRHEVNGLLIPAKDEVALAEAIRRLLVNPAFARQLGENGREIVQNEFSEALVVKKTFEVYEHLLAGK
jgi:glycosyltransferase involved in cell wall biosynthesis